MTESAPAPDALIERALARRKAGDLAAAADLFERATQARPDDAVIHFLRAETLYRLGHLTAARQALTAGDPAGAQPDANFLLGRVLVAAGEPEQAAAALERVTAVRSDAATWRFLGVARAALGQVAEAEAAFAEADRIQPGTPAIYNELGAALLSERRVIEAEAVLRRAAALDPTISEIWQNLAVALASQNRTDDAVIAAQRAAELAPNSAAAWSNLAAFENARTAFAGARAAVQRALTLAPEAPDVLTNAATICLDEGDAAAAIALLARSLARNPANRATADNFLLARHYVGRDELPITRDIASRQRPAARLPAALPADRDPNRPLRVGFVSPDFRRHSCASFLRPLFAALDRTKVELVAYSDASPEDDITRELRAAAQTWRPTAQLGDVAVAELIRSDRIDILVDLAGHMAGNRLPTFALKPASVQVSWLGYPGTTGLTEIDWRITDSQADPPGMTEERHSERLWRLPGCFLVYGADIDSPPSGPANDNGGPVFGSFNHLPKITPEVVASWARILRAIPDSRLVMKARRLGETETRERYLRMFGGHGVDSSRLDLLGWRDASREHLALYRSVDVALDPWPYNGTTTTCEALWMGVPVVTLAGRTHAGRVGASLLSALSLDELIATSADDYVARAVTLARNRPRRDALRRDLRTRMAGSLLTDADGFARRFEDALRGMWRAYLDGGA